jgi:lipid-binding SYLF domain-containing protein
VLRNTEAVKTFSGKAHLSVGAGVSASVGHVGRVAEADFRAGDGGYAACYTYSCSKGLFQIYSMACVTLASSFICSFSPRSTWNTCFII